MIKVVDDFLSEETKQHITEVLNGIFPLHYSVDSVLGDGKAFFCHCLKMRGDELEEGDDGVRSKYLPIFMEALVDYHKQFKEIENLHCHIRRAAVNVTFNNGHREGVWHKDHLDPHKHFILFLNDPVDDESYLEVQEDDTTHRIKPVKWRGVYMDDHLHRAIYPKLGDRWVLVITFDESEAS